MLFWQADLLHQRLDFVFGELGVTTTKLHPQEIQPDIDFALLFHAFLCLVLLRLGFHGTVIPARAVLFLDGPDIEPHGRQQVFRYQLKTLAEAFFFVGEHVMPSLLAFVAKLLPFIVKKFPFRLQAAGHMRVDRIVTQRLVWKNLVPPGLYRKEPQDREVFRRQRRHLLDHAVCIVEQTVGLGPHSLLQIMEPGQPRDALAIALNQLANS